MANEEQLQILKKGVEEWNEYRKKYLFAEIDLSGADLTGAKLKGANLGNANLSGAKLIDAKLNEARLINANFSEANLKAADIRGAFLVGANFLNASVSGIKYDKKGTYKGIRVETCFGSMEFKRYAQDQSYIEEFKAKGRRFFTGIKFTKLKKNEFKKLPFYKRAEYRFRRVIYEFSNGNLIYWLWKISCDCGRSIGLWAAWSCFFAFSFGLGIYFHQSSFYFDPQKIDYNCFTPFYYSIVTFTTLGFGDVTPKTAWAQFFITIEVILGYVMLGGLISIFANKIARRS